MDASRIRFPWAARGTPGLAPVRLQVTRRRGGSQPGVCERRDPCAWFPGLGACTRGSRRPSARHPPALARAPAHTRADGAPRPTSARAGCPPSGCCPRPAASWTSRCAPRRSGSSEKRDRAQRFRPRGRTRGPPRAPASPRAPGRPRAPRTSVCRWCRALYSFFISDSRSSSRETGKHDRSWPTARLGRAPSLSGPGEPSRQVLMSLPPVL